MLCSNMRTYEKKTVSEEEEFSGRYAKAGGLTYQLTHGRGMTQGVECLAGARMQQNTCASPGHRHPSSHHRRLLCFHTCSYSLHSFVSLSTMGSLLDLPAEILLFIIGFFESAEDWPVLLSLCLTSRQLYAATQRILFKTYLNGLHCHCCHKTSDSRDGLCSLLAFTQTLLSRRDLGSCVRQIIVNTSAWESRAPERWSKTLTSETIALLADAVQGLCVKNKAVFLSSIVRAKVSPLIVLLCTHAPNLEHLHLTLGEEDWKDLRSPYMPSIRKSLASPYLSKLRSLHIGGTWGQMNIIQADTLSLFLSSPRLESFSLSLLDVQGAGDSGFMHSSQSLNIASVSLTRTCLDTNLLTTLIYACKGLKTLIYEIDSETPSLVEPSDLAAILNSQSENLEFIILDLDLRGWGLHWDDYPKIESFALFINLQHLEIEQCLLTDNPELPDSLGHLVIRACEHPVARLMTNLTKRSFDSLDSLALVVLQPQSSPPNGMFGLSERFDSDEDVHSNLLYRSAFKRACRRLRKIVREACFDFDIRCEEWVLFEEGLL